MENRFLDTEALRMLIHNIMTGIDPESAEDRDALCSILPTFHAYVDSVVRGEMQLLLSETTEGAAWRETVSWYDETRHGCHETAITNACVLNRLADLYELPPVFTGDAAERHQVAAFCLEMDRWLFENRRMKLS